MNHIWVPWEEERNREIKNATRMYKADEVDTDKAKDIARIRELEEIERNLRETSKITIDIMDKRIKELEEEVGVLAGINKENQRLRKAVEEIRDKVCKFYCTWFDKGIPDQNGAATAYDLMCIVREDTTEALKSMNHGH